MSQGRREMRTESARPHSRSTGIGTTAERAGDRGGFTLVELLVVMGIIALLAAWLVSAINGAKGKARRIVCLNWETSWPPKSSAGNYDPPPGYDYQWSGN